MMAELAGTVDLATMVIALLLALVLVAGGPRRATNLLLAGMLVLLAVNSHRTVLEWSGLIHDRTIAYNSQLLLISSGLALPCVYLAFLATALRTAPVLAPFRSILARTILIGLGLAGAVFPFALPRVAIVGDEVDVGGFSGWGVNPALFYVGIMLPATLLLAVVAAVQSYRRAPRDSPAREAAKRYLVAFSLYDGSFFALAIITILWAYLYFAGLAPIPPMGPTAFYVVTSATAVVGLVLLARALLRDQLVDFDLRLKWSLSRGTLAAIFVGVVVLAVEVAQLYVSSAFGVVAGAVAALVLFLAKRPLERFADRIADVAMPKVQDSAEYRTVRKREVYRAALESARSDGVVTDKERDVLATLARELELAPEEARAIESEAVDATAPA